MLEGQSGFPDIDQLRKVEVQFQVLERLIEVAETIAVRDTELLDLCGNKGRADPDKICLRAPTHADETARCCRRPL